MKIRAFAALVALSSAVVACNDVPVRSLTSSYQVQIQEIRDKGKPAKLDILWVVDASTSMCQEQASLVTAFKEFLAVFQKFTAIDMQLAVTSSNVCSPDQGTCNTSADCLGGRECKDIGGGQKLCLKVGAVRGRFLYQPASDFPPPCVEMRTVPCLSNDECNAYSASHPNNPLPDGNSGNWVCEGPPLGMASNLWTCDMPPEVKQQGVEDSYQPGDYLFAISSQCRYQCNRDTDPGKCARLFGQPDGCTTASTGSQISMCQDGTCSTEACAAHVELSSRTDCATRCRGRECAEVCAEFLPDAAACQSRCEAAFGSCQEVCETVSKIEQCDNVCNDQWGCREECEAYLHDAAKCQSLCEQQGDLASCRTACGTQFKNQEFLCLLACEQAYSCSDRCIAEFGKDTYRCVYPGEDRTKAGCMLPPATGICPAAAQGPKILNNTVADQWLLKWMAGDWAGDPDWDPEWKLLPTGDTDADFAARETPRARVFEQLFKCMATLGAVQYTCNNQEQGLRAAWLALDPEGENADQARSFLRDDAYLLIVIISDEDDCSAPEYQKGDGKWDNVVPSEKYGWCSCLRDENGCTSAGDCDPNACLTNGAFDASKCPLYSTARFVNQLRSLKADPAQVVFAAISGDFILGSTTTPGADLQEIRKRFFECKCNTSALYKAPATYACLSAAGNATLGARYAAVAEAFGQGRYGQLSNICSDEGIGPALESIANLVIPLLTQVCLPRPLEWSCQAKCEALFDDRDKCQEACTASDCFSTCQQNFPGLKGCSDTCTSGEFIEVYKYDSKGRCARVDAGGNCLPLKFAANSQAEGDYFLVQNSPVCPLFDVALADATQRERPENAIQFKVPLEYSDRIEIVYRAASFHCLDRCDRGYESFFSDQSPAVKSGFCNDLCNGTAEECIDTCVKVGKPDRGCAYICDTSAEKCITQCNPSGDPTKGLDCTDRCRD